MKPRMNLRSWRLAFVAMGSCLVAAGEPSREEKLAPEASDPGPAGKRTTEKAASPFSFSSGGIRFQSAGSNVVVKFRGYAQADGRIYVNDNSDLRDTFLVRRIRPSLEGTLFKNYDFRLMLDFPYGGPSRSASEVLVQDIWVNARFMPELQLQVGKFKAPVGLERIQSDMNTLFVERGFPSQLVPNRDLGFQFKGVIGRTNLEYDIGLFNGQPDGGSADLEFREGINDLAARVFAHPFRFAGPESLHGFGLGLAGTYGEHTGALRSMSSPGQLRIFSYRKSELGAAHVVADGTRWRLVPQAYYYLGSFGSFAEYAISSQEVRQAGGGAGAGSSTALRHEAWQLAASYFLTGEKNSFEPVKPRHPLGSGNSGWGAVEVAARVGELDLDDRAFPVFSNPARSVSHATSFGAGVNWLPTANFKLSLNLHHTDFSGGAGGGRDRREENVVLTRVQVAF